jgi:hypothetical protein
MKKKNKNNKHTSAPKCQSIHWWAADHCWNKSANTINHSKNYKQKALNDFYSKKNDGDLMLFD